MGADQLTIKYANRAEYSGGVKDRVPEGKGKLTFKNGASFEGEFVQGEPRSGKIRSGEYVYEGECTKAEITGRGMLIDKSNTFYEGVFERGRLLSGEVIKKTKANDPVAVFKGQIDNLSPFTAKGVLRVSLEETSVDTFTQDKRVLEGAFRNGNLHGKGKYTLPNGDSY